MTPIRPARGRAAAATLVSLCLAMTASCSGAAKEPERNEAAAAASPVAQPAPPVATAPALAATENAAGTPTQAPSQSAADSKIMSKKDITRRGKAECEIWFVYAGYEPENIFWEEPCAQVTAKLMDQRELESLDKWSRLEDADRQFIKALPGGKVVYVEGSFSASIYPVNLTRLSYEVSVAD